MAVPAVRLPVSTYRLQFNRGFRFRDARALVAYLDALGITELYSSPLVQSRRGSTHGYDITDPSQLDPELGAESDFNKLAASLRRRGMGLLLDIVPNHMAASSENPWWRDVLENGPASIYADYFDIDWQRSDDPAAENKVVLPVLGAPLAEVLGRGELVVALDEGGLVIRYHARVFPLSFSSYPRLLGQRLERLREKLGARHPAVRALSGLIRDCERLPESLSAASRRASRHRRKEAIRRRLQQLCHRFSAARRFLKQNAAFFSAHPERLERLLEQQHYRLEYWKTGEAEINYRRFFDISELVSLRIEHPRVFAARHELLFRLVRHRRVTGVRVDHVDGLNDPQGYLTALQQRLGSRRKFYVVAEKILAEDEALPDHWPVYGTTGYDFLNTLNSLFVDARGVARLARAYRGFTGRREGFADVVYEKKKLVLETLFPGEVRSLVGQLHQLAGADRRGASLSIDDLERALVEVTACIPVYRTYIRRARVPPGDRLVIARALNAARRRDPRLSRHALSFLRRVLLLENAQVLPAKQRAARLAFVQRWQQLSGPAMAKGFEDTALYNYNLLLSLNEVGGNPAEPAIPANEFHRRLAARRRDWPSTLNASATHDTKRGEDVRARISVLSEFSEEWAKKVEKWRGWNAKKKRVVEGRPIPEANEEWFLYQTLAGAWPLEKKDFSGLQARLQEYMIKAAREAKVHTSWREVNADYEDALRAFVAALLADSRSNRFLRDFRRFQETVAFHGMLNSVAQLVLKMAAPGVPDFFQGCELWDLRLVDPDNRRPVDFRRRRRILHEMQRQGARPEELLQRWQDGRIKLYLTWKGLRCRRAHSQLFLEGDYIPLAVTGAGQRNVCAFARRRGSEWLIAAVPWLTTNLVAAGKFPLDESVWGNTGLQLPRSAPRQWRNVFTGETLGTRSGREASLSLAEVFRELPVTLLEGA